MIFFPWAARAGAHNVSAGTQRRWSKALVRHGTDPRAALAEVLGVPGDDIRVKASPD
jgi:hypothetical protein